MLSKTPKGFGFNVKKKKVLMLEKIVTFHFIIKFWRISVVKKIQKLEKILFGRDADLTFNGLSKYYRCILKPPRQFALRHAQNRFIEDLFFKNFNFKA